MFDVFGSVPLHACVVTYRTIRLIIVFVGDVLFQVITQCQIESYHLPKYLYGTYIKHNNWSRYQARRESDQLLVGTEKTGPDDTSS